MEPFAPAYGDIAYSLGFIRLRYILYSFILFMTRARWMNERKNEWKNEGNESNDIITNY